ncbi:major facilitator superfamily domain-containing protein 6-like [Hydra vulgaris]|uniref:major facilitator superfamily domain-containing protein 6-like n=1 Tax=Hydra vulgaris TaxID=6087 RepID=UPI001F5FCE22|nr:major facilitator superfamily domain-containing protein 6-like [Hydra vulgaris]
MDNTKTAKQEHVHSDNLNLSINGTNLENVEDACNKEKWYYIDKDMIPAKLTYFFTGAEKSSVAPFLTIFLISIGLNLKQVGYVISFSYVGQIVGSVFWGVIADKTGAQRVIFILLCFFYGTLSLSISVVSSRIGERSKNQCPIILSNNVSNNTVNSSTLINKQFGGYVPVTSTTLTYVIATLGFFMASFSGSIYSYIDARVIEKVKASVKKKNFGRQYLFGNIGFGCGTLVSGKVMDVFSIPDISCYFTVYLVSVIFLSASCISFQYLYRSTSKTEFKKKEEKEELRSESFQKDLIKTLLSLEVNLFFITIIVNGLLYSIYLSYFFLFMRQLKSSNLLIGLTVAFGSTSGVIVNFFNGVIIKLLRGTFNTMIICTFLWSVRYFIFYFLKNPWLIIPLQLTLHGLSLSLFFSVKSEHLKLITPKSIHSTMFGIVQCIHSGVSMIIGSLIGGKLIDTYGARKTFLYASIFALLWSGTLSAYFIVKRLLSGRNTTLFAHQPEFLSENNLYTNKNCEDITKF